MKEPSEAEVAPLLRTIRAKPGRERISMPMKSGMKPALSRMIMAPRSDEAIRIQYSLDITMTWGILKVLMLELYLPELKIPSLNCSRTACCCSGG